MTKTYASTAGATAPKAGLGTAWLPGWPFFIDDLHRILQEHAAGKLASCSTLADAQSQVDALLARYNDIARAPEVFQGQSVELKEGVDRSGVSHTVPIFSPRLKQSLLSMLGGKPS